MAYTKIWVLKDRFTATNGTKAVWIKIWLIFLFSGIHPNSVYPGNRRDTLEIFDVRSSINGGLYQLYVRTPRGYDDERKHPAIILLDANYYHRTFVNLYDSIVNPGNDDQVIIGIGYLPNPMNDTLFIRDFTPDLMEGFPNSGKADEFKRILETELVPAITGIYRIDESRISIVGHHFSALFLAWLLTREPPAFSNYVICSPVLTFSKSFEDFKPGKTATGIYLSMGSGKVRFLDDPEANRIKFDEMAGRLKDRNRSNPIKTSFFQSTLRYDDLFLGFSEGISFIMAHAETKGNRTIRAPVSPDIFLNRSVVLIDRVTDTSIPHTYEIFTWIPENVSGKKIPLIVVLDADFNYTELLYATQQSERASGVPGRMVVGVGYGTTIIGRGNHRDRDLLPNRLKNRESGNGNNFAAFLNGQLLTHLMQFPVDTGKMTLQGHSYGGLFLAYLLTRKNLAYQNLIISSPAVWQDKSVLRDLKKTKNRITQKIFLASGRMHDNDRDAEKLEKVLRKKTANLRTEYFPDDSHLTVISKAFKDALIFFDE